MESFGASSSTSAVVRGCMTYPVQLNGVDPLVSVLWVLCSHVPHAVVHADVQPALVELMRLKMFKTHREMTYEKNYS